MKLIAITSSPSCIHFDNGHSLITELNETDLLKALQTALPSAQLTSINLPSDTDDESLKRVVLSSEQHTASKSAPSLTEAITLTVNRFLEEFND